ncbi:hypothetical protein llap_8946 [Limosa lapponica baueri]|uniref:Uncharacterized protein n=1 Tax=Limosa lapponica baueri TaxID=1758121 RepID=A0A2I0U3S8_LIMLA|nr:hypothetical protein llap_8946 [Limosa lapponica baueri]
MCRASDKSEYADDKQLDLVRDSAPDKCTQCRDYNSTHPNKFRNACSVLLLVGMGSWSCGNLISVGLQNSCPTPPSPNIPTSIFIGFHPFLPLLPENDNKEVVQRVKNILSHGLKVFSHEKDMNCLTL